MADASAGCAQVHVCEHCGLLGYWDKARGHAVCPSTKSADHMARLQLPYACKLLFQVRRLHTLQQVRRDCMAEHMMRTASVCRWPSATPPQNPSVGAPWACRSCSP